MKTAKFLLIIFTLGAIALIGCSPAPATPIVQPVEEQSEEETNVAIEQQEKTPTPVPTVAASEYNEAPMLTEMVSSGALPPVEERLPEEPVVVTPVESVGEYGGTWYTMDETTDFYHFRMIPYEPLVRWKPDYTGYEPGLAESWEFSDDGKILTWHLRRGLKWSDGAPLTTADFKFWWEDIALNEEYKTIQPRAQHFNSDGTPMTIEFPDEFTMVWKKDTPQWIVPYIEAQGFWEIDRMLHPAHYLKQFHPTYNADATYEELDAHVRKWHEDPGQPVIYPWVVTNFVSGERIELERNPYYWKIDSEGNQLPYIDKLVVELIQDKETRTLKLSQGDYTSFRGSTDPRDIPFLFEQAEANGYHMLSGWTKGGGAWPTWMINQDYSITGDPETDTPLDQEIREVLRNPLFRKAMSVAIDRQRMIDVVWEGIGEPKGFTISPQAWHFASPEGQAVYEEWAAADAQYDPKQAEAWLDEIGMTRGADDWRTLPSGEPFELIIDVGDWGGDKVSLDGSEVLKEYLEAVGIKVILNNLIGQPDFRIRREEGTFMLASADASEIDLWTYPAWVFPTNGIRAWPKQGKWFETAGAEGWEPDPDSSTMKLIELYNQGMAEPDVQKRHELVWEAIGIHIDDGPYYLAASGDRAVPVVLQDNFHNVPETGILGPWAPCSPGNKHPEQFWISQ